MKLLSICIPTYNRDKAIAELARDFLVPALDVYSELIEIIVCDNSDADIAMRNQLVLDRRILYRKNEINLGFAGNLLRCASEANGQYIWIISDDDPILWEGFNELMRALPQAEVDGIDCINLPFQTVNFYGDTQISNRHTDLRLNMDVTISEFLGASSLPFILFSSAVIRLDKRVLPELKEKYFNNDYLQVIMYLEMLSAKSLVRFMTHCVMVYRPDYKYRFRIGSMAPSLSVVREFLHSKFGVAIDEKRDYRGWLFWMLHHRGGLYEINNADQERWDLLSQLPRYFCIRNLILFVALLLPRSILRPPYIWYRSYKDAEAQGRFSIREFRRRVAAYKKFIMSLR